MIISIFLDPENPKWSTCEHLKNLENGNYGPFYGPIPYTPKTEEESSSSQKGTK